MQRQQQRCYQGQTPVEQPPPQKIDNRRRRHRGDNGKQLNEELAVAQMHPAAQQPVIQHHVHLAATDKVDEIGCAGLAHEYAEPFIHPQTFAGQRINAQQGSEHGDSAQQEGFGIEQGPSAAFY